MHPVLIIFTILLVAKAAFELCLQILNRHHVKKAAKAVPEAFKGFINQETYDKTVAYTLAKNRFSIVGIIFHGTVLALVILSGLLPWLYHESIHFLGTSLWAQASTLFLIGAVLSLFSLPLDWWEQFHLEERFGFNKSTFMLWVSDKIKTLFLSLIIGYPLLCLLLWMVSLPLWWVWAFVSFFCFQLSMHILYPMFIMPLFNKFETLPEGDLRTRLMALADRVGFKAKTILVMDGSKRSSHSNAFFTGLGKFRRIVLFDTLLEQLAEEEVEAVLAHEIGHYKLGHIPKLLAVSALSLFIGFWLIAQLAESPWFYEAFGFSPTSGMAPALLLFTLLSSLLTFWLIPTMNRWARKHEYQADAFSLQAMKASKPLINSLRKLHEKNLSNLTPHPLYSCFYYSHPTLLEREAALKGQTS